jgi:hypothetical protein
MREILRDSLPILGPQMRPGSTADAGVPYRQIGGVLLQSEGARLRAGPLRFLTPN